MTATNVPLSLPYKLSIHSRPVSEHAHTLSLAVLSVNYLIIVDSCKHYTHIILHTRLEQPFRPVFLLVNKHTHTFSTYSPVLICLGCFTRNLAVLLSNTLSRLAVLLVNSPLDSRCNPSMILIRLGSFL